MRHASRLLARYLEAGTPTGLTGLLTHPAPRSALLYLYATTLDKAADLPKSSLYRQSVEATTKHRLALVEASIPPGHAEWVREVAEIQAAAARESTSDRGAAAGAGPAADASSSSSGDNPETDPAADHTLPSLVEDADQDLFSLDELLPEPQLTADQISELESKLSAGLIEEVIEAAEGELLLLEVMQKSKAWEPLEEKAVEGQWRYFDRS